MVSVFLSVCYAFRGAAERKKLLLWCRNPGRYRSRLRRINVKGSGAGWGAASAPPSSALHTATTTMRIITADETGLIKVVRLESGECLAVGAGEQAREHAVRAICHQNAASASTSVSSHQDGHCGSLHVVRSAGAVETWDMSQSERKGSNVNACSLTLCGTAVKCPSQPVAIASLPPGLGSSETSRVLTCNAEGEVQVISYAAPGRADEAPKQASFSIRGPVSAAITAATGAAGLALAAGGRNNDLKAWDINTNQCTWKAKNVPHDFLDMQQPVWITSLRSLLPDSNSSSSGGGGSGLQQLVAGTAHRQVRLYDARAQKRPTHSINADEHGITTMAVAPDGREVVVADTAGLVRVLDLRKMEWGRRFEGPAGSVRGLAFHPALPMLACVGLDRMARVFDYRSREQKFQVYLKQRLNAILFDGEGEVRVDAGAAQAGDHKKEGRSSGKGEDWSGSEGWGSGEEYEMDEGDSSDEEEERGGDVDKRRARAGVVAAVVNGRGRAGSSGSSEGGSGVGSGSGSSEEESDDDDDSSDERRESDEDGGGGSSSSSSSSQKGDDDSESESEEEEEAQAPPPKRQSTKANGSISTKKSRRK